MSLKICQEVMTALSFVSEVNKLKNIQLNLEKNEQVLLEHISKYIDTRIIEYHKDLDISRNKEIETIRNEVRNIFVSLNELKALICEEELDTLDFKKLKKDMICIQGNIEAVIQNTKANIDILKKEEGELNNEIKTYQQKMQEWCKSSNVSRSSFKGNLNSRNAILDQKVMNFLTFVSKSGGHENGWTADDHNLFIKARTKCSNVKELAQYLHAILPDISEEDIITHENWYIKYLELKNKHRQAIKTWRQSKSAVKPKQEKCASTQIRPVSSFVQQASLTREETHKKLKAWKKEKEEKLEYDKEIKLQLELRKKELQEKEKRRHQELKAGVTRWKSAKIEKKKAEEEEKEYFSLQEKQFKSAMANRLIKEFQSQDEIFIKRKKESCKPRVQSLEQISTNVIAHRDPKRLLKPTKQWIMRTNNTENECKLVNNVTYIKSVQKLGVPEWRKHTAT